MIIILMGIRIVYTAIREKKIKIERRKMMKIEVDARGQACPKPVIMTKKRIR